MPSIRAISLIAFTMVQAPGQPGEQFEQQCESLLRELENPEERFSLSVYTTTEPWR